MARRRGEAVSHMIKHAIQRADDDHDGSWPAGMPRGSMAGDPSDRTSDEVNGGTPISVLCPTGNVNCIPIIKGEKKVNGYKRQGYGRHALVSAGPSPGKIEVFVPIGCACDAGGFDCVCMYPPVATTIVCPNLANPGHTINCP